MSDDKEINIEGQIPGGREQGEDGAATISSDQSLSEAGEQAAEGFESDDLSEADGDDFVEEDWESYDDEYIDDGDGDSDGGAAARGAVFNRVIIGIVLVIVICGGIFVVFGGEGESLGLWEAAKAEKVERVSDDQKIEFYTETKVSPKDAFGVTYGDDVSFDPEVEKEAPVGIINNPAVITKIRNQEPLSYGNKKSVVGQSGSDPKVVDVQPPMPSPIVTQDAVLDDYPDLIPMPMDRELKNTASQSASSDLSGSDNGAALEMAFDDRGGPVTKKKHAIESVSGGLTQKMDDILIRLEGMESGLLRLDELQDSMDGLESSVDSLKKRIVKADHTPRKTKSISNSSISPLSVQSSLSGNWVLKSAQPGKAMVSKKGGDDMISVSVGQTLSGVGRITDIHILGGQWIVQGTKGQITQ